MEPFVSNFIRSSLAWLGIGVALGVAMAFWPSEALVYRPAHMHANLLGFVSMMIFGVAYHVIPRFAGRALRNRRLAGAHVVVANAGLALLVSGWLARVHWSAASEQLIRIGAAVSAFGAAFFIYNLWRTLGPIRPTAAQPRPGRPLPVQNAMR